MCSELMLQPLPFLHRATIAVCSASTVGYSPDHVLKKKKFIEVQCKPVAFHNNTHAYKNSMFPFCKAFFFCDINDYLHVYRKKGLVHSQT